MPKQPADPRPQPRAPEENQEERPDWAREMLIDHAGTELSFELTIAKNGCSFTAKLRDGRICATTVSTDGKNRIIEYVYPSVEGTVILCATVQGEEIYFDTLTGAELRGKELRKRDPHFYA